MISVIGTGSMGSAIAESLIRSGEVVTIYNRTRSKTEPLAALGAHVADTPNDAVTASDLIITVLPDYETTARVLFDELVRDSIGGRNFLNVAHTSAAEIAELSAQVHALGGTLSEVNVAVYPEPVRAQDGHFNLACSAELTETWTGVLRKMGTHVHHVGAVGKATDAEFALWLSYMFHSVAAAYSAAAFTKLEIPKDALLSALTSNPTLQVASADTMLPQMAAREYTRDTFSVDNFAHSVKLVAGEAAELGLPTKLFDDIYELFTQASSLGHGASDVSAVYEVLID